ncbi:MAG: hypothetical protein KIT87_20210, partial [Anaerolineae bacterium]|nr:hypothetical protein [Anaerolineae bacterium]
MTIQRVILVISLALVLLGGGASQGHAQGPASAIIIGTVRLQARDTHGGTQVFYDGVDYSRTNPTGQFALAVSEGGTHVLRVKHAGYLSREVVVDDPRGTVTLPETQLPMGDVDGDDSVNLIDVVIVTQAYGTRPPSDPRADLNDNGEVDIADLIGMMQSYGLSGPLAWFDPPLPSAGLRWTPRAPLITPRYSLGAAAVDGKVYAIGGLDATPLAAVEMYDPARDRWTPRAPMPTARFDLGVAVLDGKIYAVGGNGPSGQRLTTVEMYDPATDTWTPRASLPLPRGALGVAALGGHLYAVGGARAGYQASLDVYDPAADTWTARAPLPAGREYLGVVAQGDRLYAVGGYNGAPSGEADVYDPAADRWTAIGPLATPRFAHGLGWLDGHVYAVGGWGRQALASVE